MAHRHYDWMRRLRVRAATVFNAQAASQEGYAQSPEETAHQAEAERLLRECLEDLPAKQGPWSIFAFTRGSRWRNRGPGAVLDWNREVAVVPRLERLARMRKLKEFQESAARK
jgi:hypothetical protein